MRRALVVGGTGFVGLNLVDALLDAGWRVRVSTRRHSITLFLRSRAVERVRAGLEDRATLAAAMEGCDAVFLAGAHYPRYSIDRAAEIEVGVRGVANACRAALDARVPRLVYTSSTGALAAPTPWRAIDERDVPARAPEGSVYRAVKHAMERELERWVARGLPATTMIPGGCVGPWDARVGTGRLLLGVVLSRLPYWVEGTVDLVDARDVARAHVVAADRSTSGERFALGGHAIAVSELLALVAGRYGGSYPPTPLSASEALSRADAEERRARAARGRVEVPRELVDLILSGRPVDSERARRELGFSPRPLVDSLDDAYAWFAQHGYLPADRGLMGRIECRPTPDTDATAPSS